MASIERYARVLRALAHNQSGYGIKELSEELTLPPSTVHRLLQDLAAHSFVEQSVDTKKYLLGPEVLSLAGTYLRNQDVVRAAEPVLERVSASTEETTFLTLLMGNQAVCVAIAESSRPLRLFIEIGQVMPYHAAASARTILAYLKRDEVRRILADHQPLRQFTPSTVASVDDVLELLDDVRERSYAVCREELEAGVTAVAAPVFSGTGDVVGSFSLVAPEQRVGAERLPRVIALVQDAASEVSRNLGFAGPLPSADRSSARTSSSTRV